MYLGRLDILFNAHTYKEKSVIWALLCRHIRVRVFVGKATAKPKGKIHFSQAMSDRFILSPIIIA